MRRLVTTAALTFLALTMISAADQWPQFRGPNAGVIPDDPGLPDTWSETQNVVWKVDVPGMGWSSPIVWDDHVFLTSAISAGKEAPPVAGLYDEHDHIKAAALGRINRPAVVAPLTTALSVNDGVVQVASMKALQGIAGLRDGAAVSPLLVNADSSVRAEAATTPRERRPIATAART